MIEESPGVALARAARRTRGYDVHVYDPVATEAALRALGGLAQGCSSAAELLERSDVVVIATPWPEFAELPLDALERDGRPVGRDRLLAAALRRERYDEAVEIVRLGRALEQSSPV